MKIKPISAFKTYFRGCLHQARRNAHRRSQSGATLIETMAVITIILLIAGTVTVSVVVVLSQSKTAIAKNQISQLSGALNLYYMGCGRYPSQEQGLNALWEKPSNDPPEKWSGPYVSALIKKDPWNNDYVYRVPGPNNLPYEIVSYGADGQEGGVGENEDMVSWK